MKKIVMVVLSIMMVLSLAACGNEATEKETNAVEEESSQIPNPFTDFETLDEAEQFAGFEIEIPEQIWEGFTQSAFRATENKFIEIVYINGTDQVRIRKAKGTEDISGDYNEYSEINVVDFENYSAETKGSDSKVNVATWVDGDYSYAITANNDGEGIDRTEINDIIKNIK